MRLKTNIIFLYADSMRRDLSTCLILSQILNEYGYKTLISSRRNLSRLLTRFEPKQLFVIGQANMFVPYFIKEVDQRDTFVYFMPAEGFAANQEYELMYPNNVDYNFIKAIFFWGREPLDWFRRNRRCTNDNQLRLTGYARLPIAKEYLATGERNRQKIGFVGRFPAMNDLYKRDAMDFFLSDDTALERERLRLRQDVESKAISCYMELIDFIVNNTNYIVSFRPHPNEDATSYHILTKRFGNRFEIDQSFDVAEWMVSCHAIIALASSSFIDAYEVQTPVICIDNIIDIKAATLIFDPALEIMYESCYLPSSLNEAKALLMNKELQPVSNERFKSVLDENFRGDTDTVFKSIIDEIIKDSLKPKWFDGLLRHIIIFLDFILSCKYFVRKDNSLQFDYSYFFHPISNPLQKVSAAIRARVNPSLKQSESTYL